MTNRHTGTGDRFYTLTADTGGKNSNWWSLEIRWTTSGTTTTIVYASFGLVWRPVFIHLGQDSVILMYYAWFHSPKGHRSRAPLPSLRRVLQKCVSESLRCCNTKRKNGPANPSFSMTPALSSKRSYFCPRTNMRQEDPPLKKQHFWMGAPLARSRGCGQMTSPTVFFLINAPS